MTMKIKVTSALLAAAAGFAMVSCSDDTDLSKLEFPEGVSKEVVLDCYNTAQSFPVVADGKWTASVVYTDENETDWLGLLSESGEKKSKIGYVVDSNVGEAMRIANIVITSGDNKLVYTVKQQPLGAGDDNESADISKFGSNIPVGFGLRAVKRKGEVVRNMLRNQIFAFTNTTDSTFKQYVKEFDLNPEGYTTAESFRDVKTTLTTEQDAVKQSRSIGADLKVNVSYGMFKLNLHGDFKMFGSSSDTTTNFSVSSAPIKGVITINDFRVADDIETLRDVMMDKNETEQRKKDAKIAEAKILSSTFIKVRDKIEKFVVDGETYKKGNQNNLYKALKDLDRNFGPAYIREVEVGGIADFVYLFSKQTAKDSIKIHGDLNFGLNSMFSLSVNAEADYKNIVKSYTEMSNFTYRVRGGSDSASVELENTLSKLKTSKLEDIEQSDKPKKANEEPVEQKLIEAIGTWTKSLDIKDASTLTSVSYLPAPIWDLFSDEAKDEIKKYFWDTYPNGEDDSCPYTFDVRAQIDLEGGIDLDEEEKETGGNKEGK